MVMLRKISDLFLPQNILVIGDFMVDKYTYGHVNRISPEAPVPILHVQRETMQPGGAGNVVLNLLALKAKPIALGRVGKDEAGDYLTTWLEKTGADVSYFVKEKTYNTTIKNRLIAERQQLARIDSEETNFLSLDEEKKLLKNIPKLVANTKLIAISDYKKGFLTKTLLRAIIDEAKEQNIPVIVDPKGSDFTKYSNSTIIKPNLIEAYSAANLPMTATLQEVANTIWEKTKIKYLLVTRSQDGISLFEKDNKQKDFPTDAKEVIDVTGAGDTVLAMLSIALANGCSIEEAIVLANTAAQLAIEHVGCYSVTLSHFLKRLLELKSENKIFEEKHLFAVKEILQEEKFSLLAVDPEDGISPKFFHAIKQLSQDAMVVIYVGGKNPDEEYLSFLASLKEVTLIIQQEENLKPLLSEIHPSKIFFMEKNEIKKIHSSNDLIKSLLEKKITT